MEIPLKDIRLLCEQQVKGKLLRLRQAYLDIGSNSSILKNLLSSALSDLIPIFRQLIILKGQKPREQKEEMLKSLASIFSLDQEPFLAVYHDKSKKNVISPRQVKSILKIFLINWKVCPAIWILYEIFPTRDCFVAERRSSQ